VGWPNTARIRFDTWFCGSFGRPVGEQHAEPDSAPEQGGQCADREAVQAVLWGSELFFEELFTGHRHRHTPQAVHGNHFRDLWMDVYTGKNFLCSSVLAS